MDKSESILVRIKLAGRILIKGSVPSSRKRLVPAITAEEVTEARTFFPLEKFFIFGHARSGTTLLTRLVRLHPQIHCNYQAHFFTRAPLLEALVADDEVGAWLSRRSNRWNQGRDLSPLVLRAASDFIMERDARRVGKGGPGCLVGDKSPNSLLDGEAVRQLVKVYPDARLIFIVRDGRDAVISHRFQAFIDNPQGLAPADRRIREDFARDPEPFLNGQRSIFSENILRQEAGGWVRNVVETNRIAQELFGEQYIHLHYEGLLQHPHEEMDRLWAFLVGTVGAIPDGRSSASHEALDAELKQNPDADWQQQKAGEIAAALQKGKRGSWREVLTLRDRELFNTIAGETLATWGYSQT
jgi:hypothetical protein